MIEDTAEAQTRKASARTRRAVARRRRSGGPDRRIPIAGPSITDTEVNLIARAAREGWHDNYQKYVREFERQFAAHSARKYGLATSSGTGALHLAYLAAGVGPGDEVIAPNITWIASVVPCAYIGARPVFADIEPDTWCLDPRDVEHRITPRTKAILAVDLYGHMADLPALADIAKKHGLVLIEDAAQGIGSSINGRPAGSFGQVSIVSFTGTKTMVTGEGGMLLTDDPAIFQRASSYNNQCQDSGKVFWNLDIGYKYKMSNIEAACGLAQLSRLDELVARKRKIFGWYSGRLSEVPQLSLNCERPGTFNSYWMTTVMIDPSVAIAKEDLLDRLAARGIQARPFFYPISEMPPFKQRVNTPVSMDLSPRGINLPSAHDLTEDDVDYVCAALRDILNI